jgi:hypothetical protein
MAFSSHVTYGNVCGILFCFVLISIIVSLGNSKKACVNMRGAFEGFVFVFVSLSPLRAKNTIKSTWDRRGKLELSCKLFI